VGNETSMDQSSDGAVLASLRAGWLSAEAPRYWLTRFVFLRALGFVYSVAFLVLCNQWAGLFGSHGLLPAARHLTRIEDRLGFFELPTLFWLTASDGALGSACWLGMGLSLAVALGVENALYMSFCHVGQTFYGYGWEILLLETGFLAIFLCPVAHVLPMRSRVAPASAVIWMMRWLVFRVMLGAGLIKIRGDACWTALTCLAYHYETQPVPSPLSWWLHQAPLWFHKLGVLFNHVVELGAPWLLFGPRWARLLGGALIVSFQVILIVSGNLSFLNWLTIVIALACFDDDLFSRMLPKGLVSRARALEAGRQHSRAQTVLVVALALLVGLLSYGPIRNMLSPGQAMNTSFDPLHLVNSYGAFGSVGKQRNEVIVQGTMDSSVGPATHWQEYEFKCKPGDVRRRPCLITPYHYRLDWQMWFAALGNIAREPWFLRLVYKLLHGEPVVQALLARDPFPKQPPRFIRAELFEYRFTHIGEKTDAFWHRRRVGSYLRPVSLHDPELRAFLAERGWLDEADPPR
jgi:hypothetical protein